MRKIFFILATLLFSAQIEAQSINWNIEAGFTENKVSINSADASTDFATGFYMGGNMEIGNFDFCENLFLNIGLNFNEKIAKNIIPEAPVDIDFTLFPAKFHQFAVSMPIHIGYKFDLSQKVSLFINAGPYISYGICGNINGDATTDGYDVISYRVADNAYEKHIQKIDVGAGFKLGTTIFSHYRISAGYDWGFRNLSSHKKATDFGKNRTLYIGVGYVF